MGEYSVIKGNRTRTHATIQMNLKNIRQEKPDTKGTYCMILFVWNSRKGKILRDRGRLVVARPGDSLMGESLL